MMIEIPYEFGDIVYLKTDIDQHPKILTSFEVQPSGIVYELSFGAFTSRHYEFEFTTEKNVLLTSS